MKARRAIKNLRQLEAQYETGSEQQTALRAAIETWALEDLIVLEAALKVRAPEVFPS